MTDDPKFPETNAVLYRINGTLLNLKIEVEKLNVTHARIATALETIARQ